MDLQEVGCGSLDWIELAHDTAYLSQMLLRHPGIRTGLCSDTAVVDNFTYDMTKPTVGAVFR
jgi:hypothetical protein